MRGTRTPWAAALLVLGLALGGLLAGTATAKPKPGKVKADTVLRNGKVVTMDSKSSVKQAIAVRNGRIVFVGSNRGVKRWVGKRTRVTNLKGKTAMPGLIDGHAHPLIGGDVLDDCDLGNMEGSLQDMLDVMLECDASDPATGDTDWLEVSNWSPVGLQPPGTVVTRQDLDSVFPNRPVIVQGSDYHNSWANSRALELAGVTKDTPDPAGGTFVRDGDGNPTGLLVDNAQGIVRAVIPPKSFKEKVADGLRGVQSMNAVGITSTADAMADGTSLKVWKELTKQGRMSLRMNSFPVVESSEPLAANVKYYKHLASRFATERLRVPGVKMFMDGVIEYPAQTAALLDPYLEEQGGEWVPSGNRGELYFNQADANRFVTKFDRMGKLVHMHSIGDAAARVGLNAAAAARKANHSGKRANIAMAHLQLVDPADYGRFSKLNVFATMQLQWATSDIWTEGALRPYIGEQRYHRLYPARSLVKAGAPLSMGSDWPVDPLSPWAEIMVANTRFIGWGAPLLPEQSIPVKTALRAHTVGSARQLGIQDRVGSLVRGKDADLIVLDRNPLKVKPMKIFGTRVLRTIVRGKTVYRPGPGSAARIAKAASVSTGEAGHSH